MQGLSLNVHVPWSRPAVVAAKADTFPYNLQDKFVAYGSMLRDAEYRGAMRAMWFNELGDGMMAGAVLVLTDAVGRVLHSLSVVTVATSLAINVGIAAATHIYHAHLGCNAARDRAAGLDATATRRAALQRLRRSNVIDAIGVAVLLGGAAGTLAFGCGCVPLYLCLVLFQGIGAFNQSYECGAWRVLRTRLGTEAVQDNQKDLVPFINAVEVAASGMLSGIGSALFYGVALGVRVWVPTAFVPLGVAGIVAGGLMTCLSKLHFWRQSAQSCTSAKQAA